MIINEHNYESYLLDYVDGELTATEQKQLLQYIAAHPELEDELLWLQKTRPATTENIVFPGKELLYRSEKNKKKAFIIPWRKMAVAAAAAACLFLVFRIYFNPEKQEVSFAQKIATTATPQPVSPKTAKPETENKPAHAAKEETGNKEEKKGNNNTLLARNNGSAKAISGIKEQETAPDHRKTNSAPAQSLNNQSAALAKMDVQPILPGKNQEDIVPEVQFASIEKPEVAIKQEAADDQEERMAANDAGSTEIITSTFQKLSEHKKSLDSSFTDKLFALQQKAAHPIQLLNIQKIKIGNVSFVFNKK